MTMSPQEPEDDERSSGPRGPELGANPRPIRVGRVFIGMGLTLVAYVIGGCLVPMLANRLAPSPFAFLGVVAPMVLFIATVAVGIIQIVRGDRGIGIGVLIGGALIPILLAGVCVALIAGMAGSGTFG